MTNKLMYYIGFLNFLRLYMKSKSSFIIRTNVEVGQNRRFCLETLFKVSSWEWLGSLNREGRVGENE